MKVSLTAATFMAVGGVLAGIVIANPSVTMADSNSEPTAQSTPEPTESGTPEPEQEQKKPDRNQGRHDQAAHKTARPGRLVVKWQGDELTATWRGSCESQIDIKIGAENWGNLVEAKDGIQAISGTTSGAICDTDNEGIGVSVPMSQAVCYGFSKAWVQVEGKTEEAGLKVYEIPSNIQCG